MKCPTCNGNGDTGPAYDPDPCGVCRGSGLLPCDYCDEPAKDATLIGTLYCSLECLCLINAERARSKRLAHVRLPYKEN